jgi:DNA repair exonuclease SbcCD nuclease subunit
MSKFIIYGDLHLSGKNSENYISDYYTDTLTLFKEILSIAKENNGEAIISGGDNFDSEIMSLPITDVFIDLVEKNEIPLFSIWGNHEEFGHSVETSESTTLKHVFKRCKLINHLDILEGKDYVIFGKDYYHNIEEDLLNNGWVVDKKYNKKLKIGIVHGFLTLTPFLPQVLHIPISKLESNLDIIFSSHNHTPFTKIIDDIKFINLGAIGRRDISEIDIEPNIVLLDSEKRSTKVIKLKSAKPKEEIFDLTKIKQIKNFENDIEKFIASLNTTNFTSLDLLGQIKEIGKKQKVDKEIIEEVENRIKNYKND